LHDLARVYAEAQLGAEERAEAQERHARHYCAVLAAADEQYLKGGAAVVVGLGRFDLERRNLEAGQAWAAEHAESHHPAAELCGAYSDAGAYVLSLRQHPREQIRWLEAAVGAHRKLKNRRGEGAALGNL